MKTYNVLHIALLCTMLHTSHGIYTAEESKENQDTIDISNIATQYPILEEGFKILHGIDTHVPSFHDYVENNLIDKDETNFGEVMQSSQDFIADNMQEIFLEVLENEIALAKDVYIKFDRNQLCSRWNGRMFKDGDLGYFRSHRAMGTGQDKDDHMAREYEKEYKKIYNIPTIQQAIITTFSETQDPIFNYLLQDQNIFLPYIFNTVAQNNSAQLFSLVNRAVRFNHLPLATMLFDFNAINMHDAQYNIRKYLQDAVENYSLPMTKIVLDKTPRSLYQQFSFLLERAILNDDIEMLQLLLSHGIFPSNTILDMAIDKNNTAAVKQLLASPVNIEEKNNKGLTPLVCAIEKKNIYIVDALLQAGADPNNPTAFQEEHQLMFDGQIAYRTDSSGKRVDIKTQELTDSLQNFNESSDASTQKRDIYGYTPLQEAVYVNSLEIANLLIAHGANVNTSNIFDGTALQIAERYKLDKMAQLLQDHGAISYIPHQRNLNLSLRPGPVFFNLWANDDSFASWDNISSGFSEYNDSNQEQVNPFVMNWGASGSSNKSPRETLLNLIKESKIKNRRSWQPLEQVITIDEQQSLEQATSRSSQNNKRARDNDSSEEDSHIVTPMLNLRTKYN